MMLLVEACSQGSACSAAGEPKHSHSQNKTENAVSAHRITELFSQKIEVRIQLLSSCCGPIDLLSKNVSLIHVVKFPEI